MILLRVLPVATFSLMNIICNMNITDTSPEAEKVLIEILRNMSPEQKGNLISDTLQMGRELAIAGLRYRYPQATDEQIRLLFAKERLGDQLFRQAYGDKANELPD
jgi:hypothetical protein